MKKPIKPVPTAGSIPVHTEKDCGNCGTPKKGLCDYIKGAIKRSFPPCTGYGEGGKVI